MIFGWIAIIIAVALFGLTLHTWMDFGQRAQRLRAEVDHLREQVTDHSGQLALARARASRTKEETGALLKERDRLEGEVTEKRRALTDLEDRFERSRPRSHRVDKADGGDLFA